ncbi:MAG: hypothetical protein OXP74_16580 [Acidobacteriota bacterium]|nr:hypothetical protein [Acidobacteriota bacterium]
MKWTLEDFQTRFAEIVRTKDAKLGTKKACRVRLHGEDSLDSRLQCSLLLIFTPEEDLQEDLTEYLEKTRLDRPGNFDRVFLMGDLWRASQKDGIPSSRFA